MLARWFGAPDDSIMVGNVGTRRGATLVLNAAAFALVLVAYLGLEWMSFIHEYKGLPVTPWNPGLGVVFGLMLVVGSAGGLILFAGVIAAEELVLRTYLEWPTVVTMAALTALSYTAIAMIARRALRLDTTLPHLRDVLVLLAAGLAGAVLSGILLTGLLIFADMLGPRDVWNATLPLMIGDVIGIAVVTPLLLRFVFHRHVMTPRMMLALIPELLLLVGVIAMLLFFLDSDGTGGHNMFYLLFLPIVASALRHGLDGACLALALTQLGLVGLLHGRGYDAQIFTEFQTQMLVLTATGLIVGVTVSEQRNADRRTREAEARLKQKESEAAQAARFNLVSGMASALAHEITQPMTAARALARSAQHILRTPGGDLPRADENLTTMIVQIDHAGDVLRHVRDFLRRGTPHLSTIDIATMIEDSLILARADAVARRVAIELAVPNGLPNVHGDHVQLQQVLLNLVHNAIEAISASGVSNGVVRIAAQALAAPARVEISVVDNGPGVAGDLAERLFEPLTTSKHEGLGLGLSICASVVSAHGGRIWLQSGEAGRTEFRFSLPLNPPTAA